MKAVRIIALIALIAIPSSSYAWSRGGAVVVRPGFSSGVVVARPGFAMASFSSDPHFPDALSRAESSSIRFYIPGPIIFLHLQLLLSVELSLFLLLYCTTLDPVRADST